MMALLRRAQASAAHVRRAQACAALVCAALLPLAPEGASAQTSLTMTGTCEKLVVAGRDMTDQCVGTLANGVARNRTTFDFTTKDGQIVSFSGNGAQQEATEETDPLQPINVVSQSKSGSEVGAPVLAIGACRFTTPEPGRTSIACEAKTSDGRAYAGTFVTAAKAADKGAKAGAAGTPGH